MYGVWIKLVEQLNKQLNFVHLNPLVADLGPAQPQLVFFSFFKRQFRQIKRSLAEQFRQIKCSLAEQFRQIKRNLAEQFRQIKCSLAEPQYVVEARAKMSLAIMSKILASGCTNWYYESLKNQL